MARGQIPYDIKKLIDRELRDVPATASEAVKEAAAAENERIKAANAMNKIEREEKLRELKMRMGAKIERALRPKASVKLDALKSKHKLKDEHGDVIEDAYDGQAMWLELAGINALAAGFDRDSLSCVNLRHCRLCGVRKSSWGFEGLHTTSAVEALAHSLASQSTDSAFLSLVLSADLI